MILCGLDSALRRSGAAIIDGDRFIEPALPAAPHFRDRRGDRVGRLVVRKYAGIKNKNSHWLGLCDCGELTVVSSPNLESKRTQSCGCYRAEDERVRNITHGLTLNRVRNPAYNCWVQMRAVATTPRIIGSVSMAAAASRFATAGSEATVGVQRSSVSFQTWANARL